METVDWHLQKLRLLVTTKKLIKQILSTDSSRKRMEHSLENVYVDIGA